MVVANAQPAKTIKPMNGTLRALAYILSSVAVVVLSSSIVAMGVHLSDGKTHEDERTKTDRIRNEVHRMIREAVPPKEVTQRLDRLEKDLGELKAMVRDLLVVLAAKRKDEGG
jgi:hypothetical protein